MCMYSENKELQTTDTPDWSILTDYPHVPDLIDPSFSNL